MPILSLVDRIITSLLSFHLVHNTEGIQTEGGSVLFMITRHLEQVQIADLENRV